MEAQAALVGANGRIILHAKAAVDADVSGVVHPGDAELDHALRLDKALKEPGLLPLGVLVDHKLQRLKDLAHGLEKLGLSGVAALYVGIYAVEIFAFKHDVFASYSIG
jgi:hypothetical protein